MFEKLKEFFKNRIVMLIESIMILAGAVGLTVAGVSADGITKYVDVGIAIVGALDGILTMLAALFKAKK